MAVELVPELAAEPVESRLEPVVLEGDDRSAPFADDVMVVLPARVSRLVPGHTFAHFETLHELRAREEVECPVDARDADAPVAGPQVVEDLLRSEAAILFREELDDRRTRTARAVPCATKLLERVLAPIGLDSAHHETIAAVFRPTPAGRLRRN